MVKSTTKHHVHDDVGHTRGGQMLHVKRTTLFFTHFAHHLFHFSQDPRLHRTLTESESLQDRQTQLMMSTKLGVVVSVENSLQTMHTKRFAHQLGKGKGAVPQWGLGGVLISQTLAVEPVGG